MADKENKNMPDEVQIIPTSDGSFTLLNKRLDETYHSRHGALQESRHVFIKHGLDFLKSKNDPIQIFEVGFGTGLNAFLTLEKVLTHNLNVHYTTLEAFPIEQDIWSKLNYADSIESKNWFEKLHQVKWNEWIEMSPVFQFRKLHSTLQEVKLEMNQFDLIYFDAFAPNKQPELWELPMLQKVADSLKPGGVFVTYCAKGQVKRDLHNLNLEVETLTGPPGKREMVRAIKTG